MRLKMRAIGATMTMKTGAAMNMRATTTASGTWWGSAARAVCIRCSMRRPAGFSGAV